METNTGKTAQHAQEGFCKDDEEIYIKIPNPFRFVRATQAFFGHPVFTHFRNAQVEFMRGVRDVVDHEIKIAEKHVADAEANAGKSEA